jgi:hypothetical protein
VGNAGLQPAYQQLDPGPAVTDHTAPTAPGKPTAVAHFPIVADLSWPAATDDTGVTGYSVYSDGKLVSASGGTSLRLPGLTAGATYTFTVTARDAAGNESAPSGPVTVTMPAGSDLALNKPVTASSYSSPNTPGLAVDGDLTTRWAQGLGLADPSWIQVDLGAQYNVTGAIATFEKSSGYKYRIEVSPDAAHWTTLDDHTGSATTEQTNYSPAVTKMNGRYVRLTVTGSSYNGGSIYELQVYGAELPPDLALNKPVTVSSYSSPNTPGLAVDGDLNTRWAQGLGLPDPSWIQVDLGAVTSVSSVVTTFEKPSGYKYLLQYSADGVNWSTFDDHTAAYTSAAANYSTVSSPVSARYLRLTVTASSYNGGSIYELQAYGGS